MSNEHSEIELEVNDVGNVEAVVYQTDVTGNDDVAVVSRAWWQAIEKVSGQGLDTMPHVVIEDDAHLKARFDFRWQSVPIAESLREPVVMFVEPTAGSLAVVVFEPRMLVISVAISFAILGKSAATKDRYSQGEKNYSTGGKQVSCLHNFLPYLNWAGTLRSGCSESVSKSTEPASELEDAGGSGGRRHVSGLLPAN
jgi:hypothetical protein